jgi:hypothetical protein
MADRTLAADPGPAQTAGGARRPEAAPYLLAYETEMEA